MAANSCCATRSECPADWLIAGHVVVGWPKGRHGPLRRRPLTTAVNLNRWDAPADELLGALPDSPVGQ